MSATDKSDDVDLTNLNWVAGAPVPLPANFSMSPPKHKSPSIRSRTSPYSPFCGCANLSTTSSPASQSRPVEIVVTSSCGKASASSTPAAASEEINSCSNYSNPTTPVRGNYHERDSEYQKPNCSYTCLIGMALKASPGTDGCLPVNEIYKYVEKEFPYFKTAPDGWKNSVRHNLSLNACFQKVTRSDGWQGKKGFFWEIAPDKRELVNSEVDTFLKTTGRELQPHTTLLTSPIQPTTKRDKMPIPRQSTPYKVSPKVTPSKPKAKPPPDASQYSPQIQSQIAASQIQLKAELSPTQREFDMDNTPSEYIGIEAPSNDPNESAKELFGLDSTPATKNHQHQQQYNGSGSSEGPIFPFYTPVTPYYGALYGYPFPIPSSSPSPIIGISPPSPFMPQYVPPPYVHYVPGDMTGMFYSAPTIGNHMMFGMGYNSPKVVEGNITEQEYYENSKRERNSRSTEDSKPPRFRRKKLPSTPTSHYAGENGHTPKRLCLDNSQDNPTVSSVQLTGTEGQEVNVDAIVQELIQQSQKTNHTSEFGGGSTVTVHGLSDHEKDQLEQIAGVFDLENLLKSGICSLNTTLNMHVQAEESTTNRLQTSSTDDPMPCTAPIHSTCDFGDHSIEKMHDALSSDVLNQNSRSSPRTPLSTEEIIVETYQG